MPRRAMHQRRALSIKDELDRSLRREAAMRELLKEMAMGSVPQYARTLYRGGWSNTRIAEKLGIPVRDARRLTRG